MTHEKEPDGDIKTAPPPASRVKAVIEWLIEADREFRIAQSLVDKTNNRF